MSAVEKYLSQYAEPELSELACWPQELRYDHCLVIPAYDESPEFFQKLLASPLSQQRPLLILVVNRPDHIADCPANIALLESVAENLPNVWRSESSSEYGSGALSLYDNDRWGVLCIDRHSAAIPKKQGVGLARKLGCDLAARLIANGAVHSPWIHSTDADACLPADYFDAAQTLQGTSAAATYDFEHQRGDNITAQATEAYERTLHHYVMGLKHAGSPYAHHTIGSILVINHKHYCQARGFPKRSGGEDFYLLNKLAKLGTIEHLSCRITLQPRLSHRVPFGTGPATIKIQHQIENGQPLLSYDPAIFDHLKTCIDTFEDAIEHDQPLEQALLTLPELSQNALQSLEFLQCINHLKKNPDPAWKKRHFHHWLDAFRTLKFLRFLQAERFPPIPMT